MAFHRKIMVIYVVFLTFLASLVPAVFAQHPGIASEGEIKAAFIYNFIKFVEWPAHSFSTAGQHIVICILGQDGVTRALEKVSGKIAQGKTIRVKHIADPAEVAQFHALYIGQSEKDRARSIIKAIPKHVLTISDLQFFAASGGMINFYTEEKKISFVINLGAVERAGLKFSSQVLRLARIVKETGS